MKDNRVTVLGKHTNKEREAIIMTKKDFYFASDDDPKQQKSDYKNCTMPEGTGYAVIFEDVMVKGTSTIGFYPAVTFHKHFEIITDK